MKLYTMQSLWSDLQRSLPATLRASPFIRRAFVLAFEAHEGQLREPLRKSDAPVPYIVHPIGTARTVLELWVDGELEDDFETVVAAALLHDSIEDTSTSYDDIARELSPRCAELVLLLTKPKLKPGESRDLRNSAFASQIARGGDTAVFLKICDCLHNLSRPGAMPRSLLRKTIAKATGPYAQLLVSSRLESRLAPVLSLRAAAAEQALAASDPGVASRAGEPELHQLLESVRRKAKTKPFEPHDLVEMFSELPGILACELSAPEDFIVRCAGQGASAPAGSALMATTERLIRDGTTPADPARQAESFDVLEITDFMAHPLSHEAGNWLCLAISSRQAPRWLTLSSLEALIAVAGIRPGTAMMAREAPGKRRRETSNTDAGNTEWEGLVGADLVRWRRTLATASLVLAISLQSLENYFAEASSAVVLGRIYGRVKTQRSIMAKLRRRSIDLASVDDLVGLRVVFADRLARDTTTASIVSYLAVRGSPAFLLLPVLHSSIVVEAVNSQLGYKATHIRFRVAIGENSKNRVVIPCEWQFRTVHEDAWACISEHLAYKERTLSRKRSSELLRHLGDLRDKADQCIAAALQHEDTSN